MKFMVGRKHLLGVKSILYRENSDQPKGPGDSGRLKVSDAGLRWSPSLFARGKRRPLEIKWPEIFRAQIQEYGLYPLHFLIGLRTSQGPFWLSIEQLDEPAVRAQFARHLEVLN